MKGVLSKNLLLSFFAFFMAGIGSPLARAEMAQQLEDYVVINRIELLGNKTTKGFILIRELPFSIGDTIPKTLFAEQLRLAEENLNNLLLFNYMQITPLPSIDNPSSITLVIEVEERWYIWPLVEFKLEERNLSAWLQNWDFKR